MYEYKTRTRYSEYDEQGRMKLLDLLNYLQNTSSYHSFDSGLSVEHYNRIHRAWLINYWDIRILSLPTDSDYIYAGTSPHDIRGIFAYRNFWIKSETGEHYHLKADSVWFEVNTETMMPVKPSEDDITPFGASENVLGIKADTRKVRFDDEDSFVHAASVPVTRLMIDSNHHVNNVRYIAAAFDALIDSGFIHGNAYPSRIRTEYKHAAVLGDTLSIYTGHGTDDDGRELIYAAVRSPEGTEFCNIEYTL